MTYQLIRGDATSIPLADDSVDLVVTSPPYFGLRSYTDGGEHYDGQIGSEATPADFIAALVEVTRECVRVLKPSGSLWVNLGDKYAGGGGYSPDSPSNQGNNRHGDGNGGSRSTTTGGNTYGMKPKSLMGLPWRYAIGCIDQLGLILRAEIVWAKPNGIPESVTDRVRRSHEQWFHFTKEPRYFSAVDEIREPHAASSLKSWPKTGPNFAGNDDKRHTDQSAMTGHRGTPNGPNPLGTMPGSVWTDGDGTDGGLSTIGAVLNAVKDGYLTPEEGERILWVGRNDYGRRSTSPATVGGGLDSLTDTDTGGTGTPTRATDERTGSPTNSSRDQSPTGSPSTTSAGTHGVSTPTTSNPSPSARTSAVDPSQTSARKDTPTTSGTPTSDPTASESAGHACGTECEHDGPPSVWVVPTEPLRVPDHLGVDHFAAFPSEFPRRLILGWSPSGVCVECGEGRRPVVAKEKDVYYGEGQFRSGAQQVKDGAAQVGWKQDEKWRTTATITGYACACPDTTAPTRPAVVLDPFSGTGTTAAVAHALGRHGIGIDLSADYLRLAEWRCNDPALRAKVLRVDKPKAVPDGQLDIFGGAA